MEEETLRPEGAEAQVLESWDEYEAPRLTVEAGDGMVLVMGLSNEKPNIPSGRPEGGSGDPTPGTGSGTGTGSTSGDDDPDNYGLEVGNSAGHGYTY